MAEPRLYSLTDNGGFLRGEKSNKGYYYLDAQSGLENELDEPFARYCSDSAHIWKMYMDGAKVWDDELASVLNGDLDPLLIFAGLFSAILSAFLIEIRKGLQEDLQDTTNALLRTLIQDQRNLTLSPTTSPFEPSSSSRWINGLWFSSLIFSLMSALGASLAKGWVTQYASTGFGTNWRDTSSHRRRFMGMKRWRMKVIIQSLPILIHIAFFLFAAGLVILLMEDDIGIGSVVLALVIVIAFLYIGSTTHAIYLSDSPFRTPVSNIISWLTDRSGANIEFPSSKGDLDTSGLKAQALAWLLTESADIKTVEETVRAIAGLPMTPRVQDELYQGSVVSVLCRGLSECIRKRPHSSDRLNAYLHAILHLVQAGPRKLDPIDDTARHLLVSLITHGGSLQISICNSLEPGAREVALCVNARIQMMLFDKRDDTALFSTDIPILFKSNTQTHIRRLLLEVYLLSHGPKNVDQGLTKSRRPTVDLLEQLKSGDDQIRDSGHRALSVHANLDEARITLVSAFGTATLLEGLSSRSSSVRNQYVRVFSDLCDYAAFRKQVGEHGGIEQLCSLLKIEDSFLRRTISTILKRLANNEDIWKSLTTVQVRDEIMNGLKSKDHRVQRDVVGVVVEFSKHNSIRLKIMTSEVLTAILDVTMANFPSTKSDLRWSPSEVIGNLIMYDDILQRVATPEIISEIIARLGHEDWDVQLVAIDIIMELAVSDAIRTKVVTREILDIVAEMLEYEDLRNAGAELVVKLAVYDDVRAKIVTPEVIRTILGELHNPARDVRNWALRTVVKLAVHDGVLSQITAPGRLISAIIANLEHHDHNVRDIAVSVIIALAMNKPIRLKMVTSELIDAIIKTMGESDLDVQVTMIKVLTRLAFYNDVRARVLRPAVLSTIMDKLADRSWVGRLASTEIVANLLIHHDFRPKIMMPEVVNTILKKLRDREPSVRQVITETVAKLAIYSEVWPNVLKLNALGATVPKLKDRSPHVQVAATTVIANLAVHDDIRSRVVTPEVIGAIVEQLGSNEFFVQKAALELVANLGAYDDILSRIATSEVLRLVIARLGDKSYSMRQAAVTAIVKLVAYPTIQPSIARGLRRAILILDDLVSHSMRDSTKIISGLAELAPHDQVRLLFMTPQMASTIVDILGHESPPIRKAAVKLLVDLAKYTDIRATISGPKMIDRVVNKLRGTNQRAGQVFEEALVVLLVASPTSEGLFRRVTYLLEDQDPVLVRASLQTLTLLAERDDWRLLMLQSYHWGNLVHLLERLDTRSHALQTLRELARYDNTAAALKNSSSIVRSLLEMLKSKSDDVEGWRIGAEGLLALGLF